MTHVMKSLTPNAKNIFIMLAKHQLENTDSSTYIGKCNGEIRHTFKMYRNHIENAFHMSNFWHI